MSDDVLGRIAEWCEADPTLTFDPQGPSIRVTGDPPFDIEVGVDDEEVMLGHRALLPAAGDAEAAQALTLLNKRGSLLTGTAEAGDGGVAITAGYPIYLDGLNRQTFLLAVREVAGTLDGVAALGPQGLVAPAATAAAVAAAAPESEPEPAPEPVAAAEPFTATHEVPPEGMQAWADPDPTKNPTADLAGRVQLHLDETRGAWARVTGSNGWTGWVDARRLAGIGLVSGTTAVPAARAAGSGFAVGGLTLRPLVLLGGVLLIVASFLEWVANAYAELGPESITQVSASSNGWDVPFMFLFDYSTTSTQPRLGLILLIVGIVALAVGAISMLRGWIATLLGVLALAVGAAFWIQLIRLFANDPINASWMQTLFGRGPAGIATWFALAGGLLLVIGGARAGNRS